MIEDKNTNNANFSLLTQQEIDILVKFLTRTKVDSDVMSQNSIDKLIRLIQTDKDRLPLNSFLSLGVIESSVLEKIRFRENDDELCELRCNTNDETGFIELTVYNTVSGQSYPFTTDLFDTDDTAGWGMSITPGYFIRLAHLLSLKCTQATYDFVYTTFAKYNYQSADAKISEIYLPDNKILINTII